MSKKDRIAILIVLILVIPAAIPLLKGGFFHFSDEPHIADLYQMIRAIGSGQLPPRIAPDMSYGYGHPLFNFYYVLPFYLGSFIFGLTKSLIDSYKIITLITIPLSSVAMYYWLKQHTSKFLSVAGAILYVYTPYRAADLYVRGSLGENYAFIFFPLTALFVYKSINKKDLKFIGLLGLSVAALILSHNLSPIIFLPWLGLYALVLAWKKGIKNILKPIYGMLLGLGASAYWWFPALIEKGLLVKQTLFPYIDHFPFIKQLIIPYWGYGSSVWGPTDELSFQIGVVNLILALLAGIWFLRRKVKKNFSVTFLIICYFLSAVFLMNIRSNFLWKAFFLADYIQFPWRLLMITTFLSSSLVIVFNRKKLSSKILATSIVILSMLLTLNYFKPSEYYYPDDDYFLKRFFANRTIEGERDNISDQYKHYSEDYLLLPLTVGERPSSLPDAKIMSSDAEVVSIRKISAVNYESEIVADTDSHAAINFYHFPGWQLKVDGEIVSAEILKPLGNMSVEIPPGTHTLSVEWKETPLRKAANVASILSIMIIMGLFVCRGKRKLAL